MMDEAAATIEGGRLPDMLSSSENGLEDRPSGTAAQLAGGAGEDDMGPATQSAIAEIVAEQLRAICMGAMYSNQVEIARELRFGLRLIIIEWIDMIDAGVTIRDFFRLETVRVVDPLHRREENVRFLAGNAISMVIEDAKWARSRVGEDDQWRPGDLEPANITLRQILAGMRTVNEELTAALIADGNEKVEFDETLSDDDEDMEYDGEAGQATSGNLGSIGASVPHPPIITRTVPQGSSLTTSNTSPRKPKVRWTDDEGGVLVQVRRDNQGASMEYLTTEHNKSMTRIRRNAGLKLNYPREQHAIKARLQHLRKTYTDL